MRISYHLTILIMLFSGVTKSSVHIDDLFVGPDLTNRSCMNYCVTGNCFWLKCSAFYCRVKTSLKVSHRNPDFVVSAFPELGKNPWKEFKEIYGKSQKKIGQKVIGWIGNNGKLASGGEGFTTKSQKHKEQTNSTTFREVDVVGYPYKFSRITNKYFCGSNTRSFTPHYSSALDGYNWRLGITDIIYTPYILTEVIGKPYVKEWGSIYWRTGFIKQLNPAKANAVLSMRAVHIASRPNQGRVYSSATETPDSGQRFFKIPPPSEADGSDDSVWQMIYPKKDNHCYKFDKIAEDENITNDSWSDKRWDDSQSSVYNVWRPYECCKKRGQKLLWQIKYKICF